MKFILIELLFSAMILAGCTRLAELTNEHMNTAIVPTNVPNTATEQAIIDALGSGQTLTLLDDFLDADLFTVNTSLVTQAYALGHLKLLLMKQSAEPTSWSGILLKRPESDWEQFFTIPDAGFNPLRLSASWAGLSLDVVDPNASDTAQLILCRYTYTVAKTRSALQLLTWVKEDCTEKYIPEDVNLETSL